MQQDIDNSTTATRDIYNVTRLNREVRAVLEGSFPLIWIQAEISNLAQPASGHLYFSLKDEYSQVRCAMFRNRNRSLKFNPENGMSVLVRANVSLYEDRGEFQLIIERMEPAGDGALQQAFEVLKQRLFDEGLFNEDHKYVIPSIPKTIGVITSPTGAAIRDVLSILQRRSPAINVIVYPTAVQGDKAAKQIIAMLETAEMRNECDVLILTRGGGSLEDLWVFNNEEVARAMHRCSIPFVTGIGHEIDMTIADFVADQRASTPSAAAELVSPDQMEIKQRLINLGEKLLKLVTDKINLHKQYVLQLSKRLPHPAGQIQTMSQRLDGLSLRLLHSNHATINLKKIRLGELSTILNHFSPTQALRLYNERCNQIAHRLQQTVRYKLQQCHNQLANLTRTLEAVSPLASLNRGYAIVSKVENDEIIHSTKQLKEGDSIHTKFAYGRTHSTVNKIIEDDD